MTDEELRELAAEAHRGREQGWDVIGITDAIKVAEELIAARAAEAASKTQEPVAWQAGLTLRLDATEDGARRTASLLGLPRECVRPLYARAEIARLTDAGAPATQAPDGKDLRWNYDPSRPTMDAPARRPVPPASGGGGMKLDLEKIEASAKMAQSLYGDDIPEGSAAIVIALVARAREADRLEEERDQAKLNCDRISEQVAAVCVTWSKNGEVKLRAGEMKAGEMRAVRACLDGMAREILAAICTLRPIAAEAETTRLRAVVEKLRAGLESLIGKDRTMEGILWHDMPDNKHVNVTVSLGRYREIARLLAETAPDVPADHDGRAGA